MVDHSKDMASRGMVSKGMDNKATDSKATRNRATAKCNRDISRDTLNRVTPNKVNQMCCLISAKLQVQCKINASKSTQRMQNSTLACTLKHCSVDRLELISTEPTLSPGSC